MPFKSAKQRRWMHANKPEMARRWEQEQKRKNKRDRLKRAMRKYRSG